MRQLLILMATLFVLAACGGGAGDNGNPGDDNHTDNGGSDGGGNNPDDDPDLPSAELPVLHPFDGESAARGKAWLTSDVLIPSTLLSRTNIEYLWFAWGTGIKSGPAFWDEFRTRYGMHNAPFDNDGLPLGLKQYTAGSTKYVTFNCLMCHAGKVAGEVVIGSPNTTLDLQGLIDDIDLMASTFMGGKVINMTNLTGAAGATDAFGLGMKSINLAGLNTHFGYQRPQAWWTIKHKNHLYSDGSGSVVGTGYRAMMASLITFGATQSDLENREEDFEDIRQFLLSLEAPAWPQPIDSEAVTRGQVVYENSCASCHGNSEGYPGKFIATATIGTDAVRANNFGKEEETLINASWIGKDTPMISRDAYAAPPLTGIWARAPYFHNGSVPTLRAVLKSTERPTRWQRNGSGESDYDFVNVGWRYSTPAKPANRNTIESRRIYDTEESGLSNKGHLYGDALTDEQRDDLIEYLKTF